VFWKGAKFHDLGSDYYTKFNKEMHYRKVKRYKLLEVETVPQMQVFEEVAFIQPRVHMHNKENLGFSGYLACSGSLPQRFRRYRAPYGL